MANISMMLGLDLVAAPLPQLEGVFLGRTRQWLIELPASPFCCD
jgi:hypothetical protein